MQAIWTIKGRRHAGETPDRPRVHVASVEGVLCGASPRTRNKPRFKALLKIVDGDLPELCPMCRVLLRDRITFDGALRSFSTES